jgi:hypothetical protein
MATGCVFWSVAHLPGLCGMTRNAPSEYRLYCLDALGRISMAEWIDAENDQDAIQQAQLLKRDAMKCEVWIGSRLIARLDADDLAA